MENKTGKYFKYAIGEIILVVIGILIAVSINSIYQASENEKKVVTILKQIKSELSTDIIDSRRILNTYLTKAVFADKIYNNKVTLNNLDETLYLSVILNYVSFSNNNTGYNRLINNIEILPEEYSILLKDLNYLYVEHQNDVDDYNTRIKETVYSTVDYYSTNEPDYTNWWNGINLKDANKHFLEDPYTKNRTGKFMGDLFNIAYASNDYRIKALQTIHKIDLLLKTENNNPKDHLLIIDKDLNKLKEFIGTFKDDKGNLVQIQMDNNQLIYTENEEKFRLWRNEENSYFSESLNIIIKLEQDGQDGQDGQEFNITVTVFGLDFKKYKKITKG